MKMFSQICGLYKNVLNDLEVYRDPRRLGSLYGGALDMIGMVYGCVKFRVVSPTRQNLPS